MSKSTFFHVGISATCLLVLTQGPALQLASIGRSANHQLTTFAAYGFVHIVLIVVVGSPAGSSLFRVIPWPLWLLLTTTYATVFWSVLPAFTFESATSLLLTLLSAAAMLSRLTLDQILIATFIAMHGGVALSLFCIVKGEIWAFEPLSSNEPWIVSDRWVGIYFNRNSFAPVIGTALISAIFLSLKTLRSRRYSRCALPLLAAIIAVDVTSLIKTGSATFVYATALTAVAGGLWQVAKLVQQYQRERHSILKTLSTVFVTAGFLGLLINLSRFYDRLPGFDGRDEYWKISLRAFTDRPWHGYGFMAFWNSDVSEPFKTATTVGAAWGHNSYLDYIVGGGLLVAIPLALCMIGLVTTIFHRLVNESLEISEAWALVTITVFLLASTQESFLIGNHFVLVLVISIGTKLKVLHKGNSHVSTNL